MLASQALRPYVISWNLTYRCNLACEHCYLDAGAAKKRKAVGPAFADRSELSTAECFKIIDEIQQVAPEALLILTGGEPLLRKDIIEIIRYAAAKQLWPVVGSNGVLITETLADLLKREGVRGFALSLDALDPGRHDKFRVVQGAWDNTVQGARVLREAELPFIIQTTVGRHNATELRAIADFAYEELGAKVWNLYFLVSTGRGKFVSDISAEEYEAILNELFDIQAKYAQRMIVNAKCAPHYLTTLFERDPDSPAIRTFADGAGGCPAGAQYIGIRPNGDVTPCPYLPVFGGNLRNESLQRIWQESELFVNIRKRNELHGRCGACELNTLCGGCRARAYGASGDFMAEDPLCSHEIGKYNDGLVTLRSKIKVEYGTGQSPSVTWEPAARERMQKIPVFVRGMVIKAVEKRCAERGLQVITLEELDRIRAQMPTPKIFGQQPRKP